MNSIFNFNTQLLLQAFGFIFIGLRVIVRFGTREEMVLALQDDDLQLHPDWIDFLAGELSRPGQRAVGTNYWIYQAGYAIPVAVAIWWVARTPAFVKPDWVKWIQAFPPNIYQAMQADALADPEWERHVTSQKEVEASGQNRLRGRKPKPSKTGK